jgi:peroxiredoxin
MRYLGYLIILITLFSCKNESAEEYSYSYLGGEIINPNNDYVVISNYKRTLDTIKLDTENRFLYKIENLEPGIYFFKHDPENQVMILEPNDSLMFRLNTMDFDESLVFTGKGAKKNNYLIDLFLENESNNSKILDYCELSPDEFERKTDSIRHRQLKKLEVFAERLNSTPLFKEIAEAKINYNYYANKEIYPFAYYGEKEIKNLKTLPANFYNYRKDIDYNKFNLRSFFQYYRFLETHFNNIALNQYFEHTNDSVFDRKSLHYNLDKLSLIDSLIQHDSIKNDLLKYTAAPYIYKSKSNYNTKSLLADYLTRCTNEKDKNMMETLAKSVMQLEPGTKFPKVSVINSDNRTMELASILEKPTVIYFWSYNIKSHFKDSHRKINELKSKYPDMNFIAININNDEHDMWKRSLKQYNFPVKNEYQFTDPSKARKDLVINSISKVMIVERNGIIADPNANMFSARFEELLLGLLNK